MQDHITCTKLLCLLNYIAVESWHTLLEELRASSNPRFHKLDGNGTTENPEATKTPIHNP